MSTNVTKDPIDASAFTVSAIEGQEEKLGESERYKKRERKVEETNEKLKAKMMAEMAKPPPVAVIKENLKQQEKAKQEMEDVEKSKLYPKIKLYFERFPFLMEKLPKLNGRASLSEVKEYLKMIYDCLDSVGSVRNIVGYIDMGFSKLETYMSDPHNIAGLPSFLQLDLKGMTNLFRQGKFPELDPIIVQMDISRG